MLHPAATIYSGKALDEDFIRNDNSSGTGGSDSDIDPDAPPIEEPDPTPSEDLNNDQALSLAPNYHIMYELNTETKVLRVYCDPSYAKGEQEMLPYSKAAWIPWIKYRKDVETAYIEEGVLSVGRYSFFRCENLKTVYLPHSTTKVEKIVFYLCRNLETIYYAGTEEDFRNNVTWVDYQNIVGGENDPAKDKIHFGEHVKVECKNQDGYTFSAYTVGGYNVGDAYTVAAKTFPGLTLESQSSFAGNFKRGDDSTYYRKGRDSRGVHGLRGREDRNQARVLLVRADRRGRPWRDRRRQLCHCAPNPQEKEAPGADLVSPREKNSRKGLILWRVSVKI